MNIRALVLSSAIAAAAVAAALAAPTAYGSHCSTLLTTLSGAPLNGATPTGKGDWKGTPACTGVDLRLEVRNVNLSSGTVLTLDTCGRQLNVALNNREARFEIKGSAPTCTVGQTVTVRVGATTVASGTWCNLLFARCD
jgi:hypothetical protein